MQILTEQEKAGMDAASLAEWRKKEVDVLTQISANRLALQLGAILDFREHNGEPLIGASCCLNHTDVEPVKARRETGWIEPTLRVVIGRVLRRLRSVERDCERGVLRDAMEGRR